MNTSNDETYYNTRIVTAGALGFLFGAGLTLSGMINPERILGFLDIAGAWNPAVAVVMLGALAISVPGFLLVRKRGRPLFCSSFALPDKTQLDRKLLGGAVLFGVGWGLVGFCPGPAITALPSMQGEVFIFVIAMAAGFFTHRFLFERQSGDQSLRETVSPPGGA